jgi:hypothetical protein
MAIADSLAAIVAQQTALIGELGGLAAAVQSAMAGGGVVELYVDPVNGNDANVGTQASPLKTIGAALKLAPQGRETYIFLPASNVVCPLTIQGCYITICPVGRYHSAQAFVQTPATTPTVTFNTVSQGGQNISPNFQGLLGLTFWSVNVDFPAIVDTTAGTSELMAIGGDTGGFLYVNFVNCTILLRSAPVITTFRSLLLLAVSASTITIDPTVPAGTARLVVNTGIPIIISWTGVTLPTGVTLGSLIENNGATLTGVSPDDAPLSNLTSFS